VVQIGGGGIEADFAGQIAFCPWAVLANPSIPPRAEGDRSPRRHRDHGEFSGLPCPLYS
jgi:hypothetical protein